MAAARKKKTRAASASELRAKSIKDCVANLRRVRSSLQQDGIEPETSGDIMQDARKLQASLRDSFDQLEQDQAQGGSELRAPAPAGDEDAQAETKPSLAARALAWWDFKKVLKSALGLFIIVYVGWQPVQRLFQVSSVEAVVNAHLITLRSPIEGTIVTQLDGLSVGEDVAGQTMLFSIDNPRSEYPRFDDLRRRIGAIRDERLVDAKRLAETKTLFAEMSRIADKFRAARMRQLEARMSAERSEIAASRARLAQLDQRLKRQTSLFASGVVPQARIDEVRRDHRVAVLEVTTLQRRLKVGEVELEALKGGVFVGDSYNDMPYSAQRAHDLKQKIADLKAAILKHDRRIAGLEGELAAEEARARRLAKADIVLPRHSRVWELLTAQGEQVTRGQELIRLVDCSLPVVTAAVTETVYNSLSIGAPATFRYRQTGEELPGKVVQLTGVASAAANLAIMPNALKKESYRVMVKVPGLAGKANCAIGQTGRVVFGDGKPGQIAAAP